MKKSHELKNIDDFVEAFNKANLGKLKRISGEEQENPDAICDFDGKRIGLEYTIVYAPDELPHIPLEQINSKSAYDPHPAIDVLFNRIREKSLKDYKEEKMDEVWLLIGGGSYISDHDLADRLNGQEFVTKFRRIFVHKGTRSMIYEIGIKE